MGLGIALAGGIICVTMIAMLSIVYAVGGQIFEINSSRTNSADLQHKLFQTDMEISDITAASGSQFPNFTLTNTGNEKLWNFDKFDVVINYTADVSGSPAQKTEQLSYGLTSGSITVNSISSNSGNCDPCTLSHTAGGNSRVLVVAVLLEDSTSVSSVTYSGQNLIQIRSDQVAGSGRHSELWYLVSPPVGTANVVADLAGKAKIVLGAITLNGVSQSSPVDTSNGDADGSSTVDPSVTLTTTSPGSFIIDALSTGKGTLTAGAQQVKRYELTQGQLDGAGSTMETDTQGPYTMSWTNNGGFDPWALSAAAFRVADLSCGPDGSMGDDEWVINSISDDDVDPSIINTNEGASVCTKLAYPLYSTGTVQITISTDNGFTAYNHTAIP